MVGVKMNNLVLIQREKQHPHTAIRDAITDKTRLNQIHSILTPLCLDSEPGPITLVVSKNVMDNIYPPETVGELEKISEKDESALSFVAAGVCFEIRKGLLPILDREFPQIQWCPGSRAVALCAERIETIARECGARSHQNFQKDLADSATLIWMHELLHWYRNSTSMSPRFKATEEAIVQITLWSLLQRHQDSRRLRQIMINLSERQPSCYRSF
jgi:hypothetical protein